MKLRFILFISLVAFLNSCANVESPKAFHFGPGPNAEGSQEEPEAFHFGPGPRLDDDESIA